MPEMKRPAPHLVLRDESAKDTFMLSYAKQLYLHGRWQLTLGHRRCADLELGAPEIARLEGMRYGRSGSSPRAWCFAVDA
jgi:hypothetical protein